MSHEFQNTLHRNASEMHSAIAGEWLSAGGANSEAFQREHILPNYTDAEMADEAILEKSQCRQWDGPHVGGIAGQRRAGQGDDAERAFRRSKQYQWVSGSDD